MAQTTKIKHHENLTHENILTRKFPDIRYNYYYYRGTFFIGIVSNVSKWSLLQLTFLKLCPIIYHLWCMYIQSATLCFFADVFNAGLSTHNYVSIGDKRTISSCCKMSGNRSRGGRNRRSRPGRRARGSPKDSTIVQVMSEQKIDPRYVPAENFTGPFDNPDNF